MRLSHWKFDYFKSETCQLWCPLLTYKTLFFSTQYPILYQSTKIQSPDCILSYSVISGECESHCKRNTAEQFGCLFRQWTSPQKMVKPFSGLLQPSPVDCFILNLNLRFLFSNIPTTIQLTPTKNNLFVQYLGLCTVNSLKFWFPLFLQIFF